VTAPARFATVPCPFCATLNRVDLDRVADRPRCGSCGRPILLDRPLAISDASFDAVVTGATVPVVMDAYADWCGPCKIMAPVLDDFAHERAGDVLVVKLDTDRNPATSQRFGIRSIPTLVVFAGGREVGREVGVVPRARLDALWSASSRAPGAS
jgi:thioredoxin 2